MSNPNEDNQTPLFTNGTKPNQTDPAFLVQQLVDAHQLSAEWHAENGPWLQAALEKEQQGWATTRQLIAQARVENERQRVALEREVAQPLVAAPASPFWNLLDYAKKGVHQLRKVLWK